MIQKTEKDRKFRKLILRKIYNPTLEEDVWRREHDREIRELLV